jgi:hypothetical protein
MRIYYKLTALWGSNASALPVVDNESGWDYHPDDLLSADPSSFASKHNRKFRAA